MFSQEQLAECPKLRVGLNFPICETKALRQTGCEAFIVCGFEFGGGEIVCVFLCSKVTEQICEVLLPFGCSYPPGEDIDFFHFQIGILQAVLVGILCNQTK